MTSMLDLVVGRGSTFLAWADLAQTGAAYSAVEQLNAKAAVRIAQGCDSVIFRFDVLRTFLDGSSFNKVVRTSRKQSDEQHHL